MSTIINNYPVFEDSQVLTSGQLNQMIKYLDQQNRLTRVTLIGMGIVCGMKVSCETAGSKTTLTISKGVGVTSEGFLIGIGDCHTTRYRDYNMPGSVSYPPFEHEDLELYELLTESAITNPEDVVTDLDESFLSDKVVLLYLECFDKDLKSCLGKSCDELGIDRIFTLRKLLITEEQLENLVWPKIEGGKSDASYPDKNLLPPHLWARPLMDTDVTNYYGMGIRYLSALTSDTFLPVLGQTYDIYEPVLSGIYGENPFSSSVITDKLNEIMDYIEGFITMDEPVYGVQYIYDFVKDLALAYNEFRDVSFNLSSVCCPDMDRFPKHLMLGEACGSEEDVCVPLKYRNEFTPSPVLSQQQDLLEKVRFLHKRIVLMIESFDLDRLRDSEKWPLKITPSCEKKGTLSQRTIPVYYDSKRDSDFENLGTLENNWNYEIYKRCFDSDYPRQLSYDNHEFDSEPEHPVTTPLGFELDQFNFLRIEGILAKPVEEVKNSVLEAKSAWNLSFDVKTVYFGELLQEKPVPACLVANLQPDYSIWRHKLLLLLNNMVRANRTVETTIKNRREYKAEFSKTAKKTSYAEKLGHSAMSGGFFDMQEFASLAGTEGKLDFSAISRKLYESEIRFAGVSDRAKAKRSASFATAEDTSISSLFADLNNCLLGLIKAMPEDFNEFSMTEWLDKYKCAMQVYIRAMKFISTYANSNVSMIRTMVILMIMCLLFDVIRFFAIYPYITIRTLYDTLQERIDRLAASLEFSNFQKEHPGMEHKAGVAPGHTFILVYQNSFEGWDQGDEKIRELLDRLNEKKLIGHDQQLELSEPDPEKITEALQEMNGMVVADFTLPYLCCDECGDLPHTPLPLDPLVTPICGIVSFADQKFSTYRSLSKKILNNLYDPAVYKAELTSDPKLGTASLSETPYLPDPLKVSQMLNYEVDPELIEKEKGANDDYIFIDEFDYQVRDITRDEVVGKDTITIFIPIVREEQASVAGTVTGTDSAGNQVKVPGANVTVVGTDLRTTTAEDGTYQLQTVPLGDFEMAASHGQFGEARQKVTIENGENTVDFNLQIQASFGELTGTVLLKADSGTKPVPGVSVSIDELDMQTTTDRVGEYTLSKVPYGTFKVRAFFNDIQQEVTTTIDQPRNTVNIVFQPDKNAGTIKGSVRGISPNGKEMALPQSTVRVHSTESIGKAKGLPKYSGVSVKDGSFSIEGVTTGTYLVRVTHNGYYSDEQTVNVNRSKGQPVDFVMRPAQQIDIKYDRIYESMQIVPDTPQANNIRDYYSSRMGDYKREAEKTEEKLGGTEITAISKARRAIKQFADTTEISVVKLNNEYNGIRNELLKGWENSKGEEKELHAEALQNLTGAYLDRLAFTQPDKLTDTSKDVLKETGSIISSHEDLKVKEAVQNWLNDSEGYLNNDFRANVQRYMKVK